MTEVLQCTKIASVNIKHHHSKEYSYLIFFCEVICTWSEHWASQLTKPKSAHLSTIFSHGIAVKVNIFCSYLYIVSFSFFNILFSSQKFWKTFILYLFWSVSSRKAQVLFLRLCLFGLERFVVSWYVSMLPFYMASIR
jgi:hypothetical protein